MHSRRHFISGSVLMLSASVISARAQDTAESITAVEEQIPPTETISPSEAETLALDDPNPPLPEELANDEGTDEFFSTDLSENKIGKNKPPNNLVGLAREIINSAPYRCRPIDVAEYYRAVGQGKNAKGAGGQTFNFGAEGRPYARAWPYYYNPVVIEFFRATSLNPLAPGFDGDAVPWCAAFLNYCIERAVSGDGSIKSPYRGTRSASSGSFRCQYDKISLKDARHGDIVVWAKAGSVNGCAPGQGHVGFFHSATGNPTRPFIILGGNQTAPVFTDTDVAVRSNAIVAKTFPSAYKLGGGTVQFHSIRSDSLLRSA